MNAVSGCPNPNIRHAEQRKLIFRLPQPNLLPYHAAHRGVPARGAFAVAPPSRPRPIAPPKPSPIAKGSLKTS